MKKETEVARAMLDGTKSVLEKTEIVLAHTNENLSKETLLRKAHETTEERLAGVGQQLLSTLELTKGDVQGLHKKLRRKSDLQSMNRDRWQEQRSQVIDSSRIIDSRLEDLRKTQEDIIMLLSSRMQTFVADELQEVQKSQAFLVGKTEAFQVSEKEVNNQTAQARDEMNGVLGEITTLRQDVKQKVGVGLSGLSAATQRISAGIASELESFHGQVRRSTRFLELYSC